MNSNKKKKTKEYFLNGAFIVAFCICSQNTYSNAAESINISRLRVDSIHVSSKIISVQAKQVI